MLGKADGSAVRDRKTACEQGEGKGVREPLPWLLKPFQTVSDSWPWRGPAASLLMASGRFLVSLCNQLIT